MLLRMLKGCGVFSVSLTACAFAAALSAVLLGTALAFPALAHATYADCDDEHAAAQDVGTYGNAINAADIPDGTYEVEARTDSYMCIFYRNAEDAESKVSKEKCYVQVASGKMTAVFWISSMYNRLYLGGSAEDAAALTDKTGADDSAYLKGNPAEGYVPHYYTMAIPALNYPMNFASFAGGKYPVSADPDSTWFTRAKWYSHVVVFKPTKDTLAAIDAAKNPTREDEKSSSGSEQERAKSDEEEHPTYEPVSEEPVSTVPQPVSVPVEGGGQAVDQGWLSDNPGDSGGRRGVRITAAGFDLPEGAGADGGDVVPAADVEEGPDSGLGWMLLSFGLLIVAGAGYRIAAFALSRRNGASGGSRGLQADCAPADERGVSSC